MAFEIEAHMTDAAQLVALALDDWRAGKAEAAAELADEAAAKLCAVVRQLDNLLDGAE